MCLARDLKGFNNLQLMESRVKWLRLVANGFNLKLKKPVREAVSLQSTVVLDLWDSLRIIRRNIVGRASDVFLNRSAKEAMIGIVDWYANVNERGHVTINDLATLKMYVDLARDVLDTNKELMDNENNNSTQQSSFDFVDYDDIPF